MLTELNRSELKAKLIGRKITNVSIIGDTLVYLQLDDECFLEITPEIEYGHTPVLEVEYGKEK